MQSANLEEMKERIEVMMSLDSKLDAKTRLEGNSILVEWRQEYVPNTYYYTHIRVDCSASGEAPSINIQVRRADKTIREPGDILSMMAFTKNVVLAALCAPEKLGE